MTDSLQGGTPKQVAKIMESMGLPVPDTVRLMLASAKNQKAQIGYRDEFTDDFGRDGFDSPGLEAYKKECDNKKRALNKTLEKGDR